MDQDGDFGTSVRVIAAAVVSAIAVATLVIAIGQPLVDRSETAPLPRTGMPGPT